MGVLRMRSSVTFSRKFASASHPIQPVNGQKFSTHGVNGQRDNGNGDDFLQVHKTKIKTDIFLFDNLGDDTRTPHEAILRFVTAPLR